MAKFTNQKTNGKSQTLGTNIVFVCYLLLREENIHINLICFHCNFDHPHIDAVTFVPRKQSKKPQFFRKKIVCVEKVFNMYLPLGLA